MVSKKARKGKVFLLEFHLENQVFSQKNEKRGINIFQKKLERLAPPKVVAYICVRFWQKVKTKRGRIAQLV